ncbi:MAG: hypothetical protein CMH84_00645 [Nocardioides sp.]|jgi:hypothetical protein|uniref:Antitoxin VbhA domain-containing protein n=1 Tax=Microbacterium ginsengisoli TaxID=400772 RepID=A0A0F0LXC8_9MICO|nr:MULTISPECIES: antitoxin VbhA family protein [Micrococcales]KJL40897.1 hypothetical protein RR49_00400 [Microbacterium ginsengisoli]MAY95036.1 hypothetical protein [Nocardioides sp.]MEA1265158.1 antitoxin VbhA family protein [Microbacterium sp. STF-2]MEE2524379.1 antitoxin VbhA family protein [Pseudarthrobacter sp. J47]|tara:strand:- start:110 stop:346 length:237 start_codon:yes stop_codon:yes gene_type:complete
MQTFDVEDRWPELFVQLDDVQRNSVRQSLAAGWHEGFNPTREDVENLTDYARGAIDFDEYIRRADATALRTVGAVAAR